MCWKKPKNVIKYGEDIDLKRLCIHEGLLPSSPGNTFKYNSRHLNDENVVISESKITLFSLFTTIEIFK